MTTVSLRPVAGSDEPFLRRVYASTREAELAAMGWGDEQKSAFCQMQFDAQTRVYTSRHEDLTYDVILVDGQPAGRLWLSRGARAIGIVDIALLPEFRGRGIGGQVLRDVLALAQQETAMVSLHVERTNPAGRLYDRLGFVRVDEDDVYARMEWAPRAVS